MSSILATALVGSLIGAGVLLNKPGRQPREEEHPRLKINDDEQPNQRNAYHSERIYDTWNTEFGLATKSFLQAQDPVNENVVPLYYNQMSLRQQMSPEFQGYLEKRTNKVDSLAKKRFINEGGNEQSIDQSPMFQPMPQPQSASLEQFNVSNRPYGASGNGTAVSKEEHFGNYTISGPVNSNNPEFHNNMVPFARRYTQNTDPEAYQATLETYTGQTGSVTEFRSRPKREMPSFQDLTPGQSFVYGTPIEVAVQPDRYITSNMKTGVTPFQQIRVGRGIVGSENSSVDVFEAQPKDGFHPWYRPGQRNVDELRVNPKNTYEGRVLPGQERVQNRGFSGDVFKRRPDPFYVNTPDRWNKTTGSFTAPAIRENFKAGRQNREDTNIEYVGGAGQSANLGSRPGVYGEGSDIDYGGICQGGELGTAGYPVDRDGTLNGGIPFTRASDALLRESEELTGELESGAACTLSARVRHTLRNQLKAEPYRNLGLQGGVAEQTQRPYDKMRANTRDTTNIRDYMGQAYSGDLEGQTTRPYDKMRPNTRDTTNIRDYMGQAHSADLEAQTKRPYDKMRPNTRDTTNIRDYMGQAHSADLEAQTKRPYDKMRPNTRDTTNIRDYMGQAHSADLEAQTTRPYDKMRANIRDTTNIRDYMGISSAASDNQKPRKRPYDKARNNLRATTNIRDYVGISGSVQTRQPVSYASMYNATSRNNQEELLEGRTYGPNKSTNITAGACDVNIQIKERAGYDITRYGQNETRLYQAAPSIEQGFQNTTSRNQRDAPLDRQPQDFMVEQFNRNPYTQSLESSTPLTSIFKRGETPFASPECTPDRLGVNSSNQDECLGNM